MGQLEEQLLTALRNRRPSVRLERCGMDLGTLFRSAVAQDPRVLALLSGYEARYVRAGLLTTYEVTLQYRDDGPATADEVAVADARWQVEPALSAGDSPRDVWVVTDNLPLMQTTLDRSLDRLQERYEGCSGWQMETAGFPKLSTMTVCRVSCSFLEEASALRCRRDSAQRAAESLWRDLLGHARVPVVLKPFLAFSYLAQDCVYDHAAGKAVEADPLQAPDDPVPHLSYGPLVEKRGVCGGFAWAFKRMMDAAGVECRCISGFLQNDRRVGHMWNLVKLDGAYYHVDVSSSLQKRRGAYVGFFMQPDGVMRQTHDWDATAYPAAKGTRLNYDFLRDILEQHGDEYLRDGVPKRYLFPARLVE